MPLRRAALALLILPACAGPAESPRPVEPPGSTSIAVPAPPPSAPSSTLPPPSESATPTAEETAPAPVPPPPAPLPTCPPDMVLVTGGASTRALTKERFEVAPFCLDRHEVTVRQYLACAKDPARKCSPIPKEEDQKPRMPGRRLPEGTQCNGVLPGRLDHPVNCVTWAEASHFCASISKRLPTADEWEMALRGVDGGVPTRIVEGNLCNVDCAQQMGPGVVGHRYVPINPSTVRDGFPTTAPVGSFPDDEGASGARDMFGNVREWTSDAAPDKRSSCPNDEPCALRVVLGYSWWDDPVYFKQVLQRDRGTPEQARRSFVGFRCAR